jgi:16S rRNA (uracil1498-N3)-methyltransferase
LSIDKNAESHLLPRLYVGHTQQTALSLEQFLINNNSIKNHPLSSTPLQQGTILQLSPGQTNYVTNVMRMVGPGRKKGRWTYENNDPCVRVFTDSEEWVARLDAMDDLEGTGDGGNSGKKRRRKNIESMTILAKNIALIRKSRQLQEGSAIHQEQPITMAPLLCFAPPKKKDRFQWILEKSTELGMAGWLLLQTDRTEASTSRDYWRKGQAYVLEAAEQCERLSIPPIVAYKEDGEVSGPEYGESLDGEMTLSKLSSILQYIITSEMKNTSLLICRERSDESTPMLKALQQIDNKTDTDTDMERASTDSHCCIVLVGPEGGWSPEEEALFDANANQKHIWNVSLGGNVLRTDTAAVTAVAAFTLYNDA